MRPVRAVMSIQSSVVYGHVGSTAATLPLQRLGFDVWALPTVVYSSHAGYAGVRGRRTPISTLRELLAGLESLGRLDRCEAVLSGYLGRPEAWSFVLEALAAVRVHHPGAWYICDPVLGDEGELYVPSELVRTFREQAVPRADLLVPNRFELEWLVDRPVASVEEAVAAARELHEAGAREVVVKGLVLEHDGRPMQHVVGLDAQGAWLARAPHIAQFWSGAGDVFTALLTGLRLSEVPLGDAVARATALMAALVARTYEVGAPELRLIEIDWASHPPGARAERLI
jgi:pyridoxine kinase